MTSIGLFICFLNTSKLKIVGVTMEGQSKTTDVRGFPIQMLPFLPLELIAKHMAMEERLSLALTSTKTEQFLMRCRFHEDSVQTIFFCDQKNGQVADITISTDVGTMVVQCGVAHQDQEMGAGIIKKVVQVSKWCDKKLPTIHNAQTVYRRICRLIPSIGMTVYLGRLDTADVEKVMVAEEFKDWMMACVNGDVDARGVGVVMDHSSLEKSVICSPAVRLPDDFTHEKAFHFKQSHYVNARWVRIEHLLSMRGVQEVTMMYTDLKVTEINTFIHHCMESEEAPLGNSRLL
ncbi:hypothetical protein CRE_10380 [Caenorhabditis remanei]|uniref:F-box domain-containing protein n=1 Tax=Caenorhabditis remanei TaxID=31234 RepID=E3MQG0_CAERE|nr:hypothetical protein CRE_10380 [Caenorhabditis remanei]